VTGEIKKELQIQIFKAKGHQFIICLILTGQISEDKLEVVVLKRATCRMDSFN
jgi:hypothetical protein